MSPVISKPSISYSRPGFSHQAAIAVVTPFQGVTVTLEVDAAADFGLVAAGLYIITRYIDGRGGKR